MKWLTWVLGPSRKGAGFDCSQTAVWCPPLSCVTSDECSWLSEPVSSFVQGAWSELPCKDCGNRVRLVPSMLSGAHSLPMKRGCENGHASPSFPPFCGILPSASSRCSAAIPLSYPCPEDNQAGLGVLLSLVKRVGTQVFLWELGDDVDGYHLLNHFYAVLCVLHTLSFKSSLQPCKVDIIIPILQKRRPRPSELQYLARLTARK